MLAGLERIPQGDVVLLHACCHNPTGFDLSHDDWRRVLDVVRRRELLPLIDFAYQGFGDGLEEDAWAVRLFAGELPEVLVTSSCSKNFGLYRDRVGALIVCAQNAEKLTDLRSQLAFLARNLWSTPPAHGAEVVAAILGRKRSKACARASPACASAWSKPWRRTAWPSASPMSARNAGCFPIPD